MSRRLLAFAAAAVLAGGLSACGDDGSGGSGDGASAKPTTPPQAEKIFAGMNASELLPLDVPLADQEAALRAQAEAGVGLLRQTFRWNEIEPRKDDWAFGMHDRLVESATKAGIQILPVVFAVRPGAEQPRKKNVELTATTTRPPRDPEEFAQYAAVLVKRYGRGGSFWKEHPELPALPMTSWQIWNEPNLGAYWGGRANQFEYTAMLKASARAIRTIDPKAEIVLGGLPESKQGIAVATYIDLLRKAGANGSYDTLAIHPYSPDVGGVMEGLQAARDALDEAGEQDVPIWITEVGWADNGPKGKFTVSSARQAELVSELYQRTGAVAEALKLRGVAYYGWRDVKPYPGGRDFWGLHTGLMTLGNDRKPALRAYEEATTAIKNLR